MSLLFIGSSTNKQTPPTCVGGVCLVIVNGYSHPTNGLLTSGPWAFGFLTVSLGDWGLLAERSFLTI